MKWINCKCEVNSKDIVTHTRRNMFARYKNCVLARIIKD